MSYPRKKKCRKKFDWLCLDCQREDGYQQELWNGRCSQCGAYGTVKKYSFIKKTAQVGQKSIWK